MTLKAAVTDYTFLNFDAYAAVLGAVGVEIAVPAARDESAFLAIAEDADAVLHEHLDITAEVIHRMPRCRVIAHHGKGVDNIDIAEATRRGIVVANVLDASLYEVAEHVFALALAVARRLRSYDEAVRAGTWDVCAGVPVHRLHGKTFGLIGFGRIAQQVALTARAFGMSVVVYARRPEPALAEHLGVRYMTPEDVAAEADILSVHLPLTADTRHFVGASLLQRMKPTSILINVSRGALVDETALADALEQGRIFGAGLDVLTQEPPAVEHRLTRLPNALVTPHCAWYSEAGRLDVETRTAKAAADVLANREPESWVNPEARAMFEARWGPLHRSY
jgi:D-3-phosphoglycerate dehydrogenase / 2-oxoglutarate reductase